MGQLSPFCSILRKGLPRGLFWNHNGSETQTDQGTQQQEEQRCIHRSQRGWRCFCDAHL